MKNAEIISKLILLDKAGIILEDIMCYFSYDGFVNSQLIKVQKRIASMETALIDAVNIEEN